MANNLGELWKKGTTAPLADDIPEGGLAIDVANEKAYSKNSSGGIFEIGGGAPIDHTHPISDIDGLQAELDSKEPDLGVPDVDGKLLSSTTAGARSWITPPQGVTEHNLLTGRDVADGHPVEAITGLQDALDDKATVVDLDTHIGDTANPHSVTKAQVGLGSVENIAPADMPISSDTQAALNLKANAADVYAKGDHIDISSGTGDAGKPIVLNGDGQIDPSMIDASTFYYVASHDPSAGIEYPDTDGESTGAFWDVATLTAPNNGDDYDFQAGDLQGKTIKIGDFMVWGTGGWSIMSGSMNPELYYKLDGTNALTDNFAGGGFQLKNIADGTDPSDAVVLGQVQPLLDEYVRVDGDTMTGDLEISKDNAALHLIGGDGVYSRIQDSGADLAIQTNRTNIIFGGVAGGDLAGSVFVRKNSGTTYRLIEDKDLVIGTY